MIGGEVSVIAVTWFSGVASAGEWYEIVAVDPVDHEVALRVRTRGPEFGEAPDLDDHCPYQLGLPGVGSEIRIYDREGLDETFRIHDPPIEGKPCTSPEEIAARTAEANRRLAARGLDPSRPPPTRADLPAEMEVVELDRYGEPSEALRVRGVEITHWSTWFSASVYTTRCARGAIVVAGDVAVVPVMCATSPAFFDERVTVEAHVVDLVHPAPVIEHQVPSMESPSVQVQAMDLARGLVAFKVVGRRHEPRSCAYPGMADPLAGVILGHMDVAAREVTDVWTIYRPASGEEPCTDAATASAALADAKARSLALGLDRSQPAPVCIAPTGEPQDVTWGGQKHTVRQATGAVEVDGKRVVEGYDDTYLLCSDGKRGVVLSTRFVRPLAAFDLR